LWSIDRWWLQLLVLALGTVALASGHFENPDAHLRLSQAFSLLEGRGFALADGVGNPRHGNIAAGVDGRLFSVYSPGQIVLFVPAALAGTWGAEHLGLQPHYGAELLASFSGVGVHLFTALILYSTARSAGRSAAFARLTALLFAFATCNLPSARDGYEHPYEALAILIALTLAMRAREAGPSADRLAMACGAALGVGVLFRNTTLLGLPAALMLLPSPRTRAVAAAALVPALLTVGAYNTARFGSPLETGYLDAWRTAHADLAGHTGFSLAGLPAGAAALWLSPGKGMLVFSPILSVTLVGAWRRAATDRPLVAAVLTTCAAYTLLYGANFAWHGSAWCWGPRYLMPLTPLLLLLLPGPSDSRGLWRVILSLGGLSAAIQCLALLTNHKRHLLKLLTSQPEVFDSGAIFFDPRLSPVRALPQQLADCLRSLRDDRPLYLFHADGPWRNEGRPVGIGTMLEHSVDLNTLDLWWVRVLYFPISDDRRLLLLAVGLLTTVGFGVALRRVVHSRMPR
jgi:hypothetical protein